MQAAVPAAPLWAPVVVEEVRGNAMEITATIDPGEAQYIRLNVLRATDKSEYTAVNFHREIGKDYANRSWNVRDSMITLDPTFSTMDTAVDMTARSLTTACRHRCFEAGCHLDHHLPLPPHLPLLPHIPLPLHQEFQSTLKSVPR